jgi:two-component system, NtrC family, sensor histidine kinase PilS
VGTASARRSWLGPLGHWPTVAAGDDTREFARIWQGFMVARFTLALVMLALQVTLMAAGIAHTPWLVVISLCYFGSTLLSGLFGTPHFLGSAFNGAWIRLVGLDVAAFASLQFLQGSNINYTPLFAMPILLASVLGSLQLALGTAAGVTMLLLGSSLWSHLSGAHDAAPYLVQAALSGVGYFAIALLANQLASRLANAGLQARRNHAAVQLQRQVNEMVMESLPDGVLIVGPDGAVLAANPSASELLCAAGAPPERPSHLNDTAAWAPLLELSQQCLLTGRGLEQDVTLRHPNQGPRRLRVRTRLTDPHDLGMQSQCVLFLQDLRELEARMRTDKLASMGRMSTAVAHDIRNPLAAITQANALLEEDLQDPRQLRLATMIAQNARRLAQIVDDILDATRVQVHAGPAHRLRIGLNETVQRICHDWGQQNQRTAQLQCVSCAGEPIVFFDPDQLRRVLINLLDNAGRYASNASGSIQVHTSIAGSQQCRLEVWSDGAPMDQSVERHLFEPFFSSESRSNGLGLYICRALCEGHQATIFYQRASRAREGSLTEGNEFVILLERPAATQATPSP